jgi:hypothetical protein
METGNTQQAWALLGLFITGLLLTKEGRLESVAWRKI